MSLTPSPSFTGCDVDTDDWALLFNAIQVRLTETIDRLPDCDSTAALQEAQTTLRDCMLALEQLHRTARVELHRRQAALDQALGKAGASTSSAPR